MTATLVGFDHSLTRAAANLGANPTTTFFKVIMPLILPGVISGGLFAFVTSFDEVVVVLFIGSSDQQTIPRQMWNGIREQISPAILAVATILVAISIALLATLGTAAPPVREAARHHPAIAACRAARPVWPRRHLAPPAPVRLSALPRAGGA